MTDWRAGPWSPDQCILIGVLAVSLNLERLGRLATL